MYAPWFSVDMYATDVNGHVTGDVAIFERCCVCVCVKVS